MPKTNGHDAKPIQVVFATPTLSHSVSIEFYTAMLTADQLLGMRNIDRVSKFVGGDPFVWKARNRLVSEALEQFPDMTDLFMIDDDVGFPSIKVLEFLRRPEDVVAGVYPKKNQHGEFPVELATQDGRLIEQNGLYKALSIPAGFLRIKRHVLETLSAASPLYVEPDADGSMHERRNIFECGVVNGQVLTEDAIFCQKWRDLGGDIWVDPDVAFTHRGHAVWNGNLSTMITGHLDRHPENAPSGYVPPTSPDLSPLRPEGAA